MNEPDQASIIPSKSPLPNRGRPHMKSQERLQGNPSPSNLPRLPQNCSSSADGSSLIVIDNFLLKVVNRAFTTLSYPRHRQKSGLVSITSALDTNPKSDIFGLLCLGLGPWRRSPPLSAPV